MVSVINTVDTQHEDMIHDAQMDFYGTRLATCSSDRCVKVFEVREGQQYLIADLRLHEGPVWQVSWSHPKFGSLLGSCGYDRKVIVWKETGNSNPTNRYAKLYEYTNFDSSVNSLSWAPYEFGLMLAAGSSDGSIAVIYTSGDGMWDSKKINNAHTIGCNAVSWGPAIQPGEQVYGGEAVVNQPKPVKRFASGGCDNLVKIWKEEDGKWVEEHKLAMHSDWVRDVAWAPSVGLPKSIIASCSQDRQLIIWSNDGSNNSWTPRILHTFPDVVWHVSWSITGSILAVSGGDNKVSLWEENLEGQWTCISDVNKGQGQIKDKANK